MNIQRIQKDQWNGVKEIYLEAFPKSERKPFFLLKRAVRKQKAEILTAEEDGATLGFTITIPYKNLVMVDYLAVSGKIRSRGTGSQLLQHVCSLYKDKKILLLIEKLDPAAENQEQRIARRKFYLKNGFFSSDFFADIGKGCMEILSFGQTVSPEEYLDIQRQALGNLFFRLAQVEIKK